jgi:hypothetical protein
MKEKEIKRRKIPLVTSSYLIVFHSLTFHLFTSLVYYVPRKFLNSPILQSLSLSLFSFFYMFCMEKFRSHLICVYKPWLYHPSIITLREVILMCEWNGREREREMRAIAPLILKMICRERERDICTREAPKV